MRHEFQNNEGWYSRGYLPHYDVASKYQMITYRLGDSLPQVLLLKLKKELAESADCQSTLSPEAAAKQKFNMDVKKRQGIEAILDQGYGSCLLKDSINAAIIVKNWTYFDSQRYQLIAYVVMPNHVHILIRTFDGWPIGELVKTWKTYTAKEIRKSYETSADCQWLRPGILIDGHAFWQREYWDRFIRDERHFHKAIDYIHYNPLKAGLCESKVLQRWCRLPIGAPRDFNIWNR